MLDTYLNDMIHGTETRKAISNIRSLLKDQTAVSNKEVIELRKTLVEQKHDIDELLHCEDAKTRQNLALLLGDLMLEVFEESIFEAYIKEEQLFVKSAYLKALQNFTFTSYLP